MQTVVFTGRLAADPQVTDDYGKAVFRLLESRGRDRTGAPRVVGVNCVSWSRGLNEKVIAVGMSVGAEVMVVGGFVDTHYQAAGGEARAAKELVVQRLAVLDWTPPAAFAAEAA